MTGTGEKFGKLDSNIKNGMSVKEASDQIIRALTVGRTEFIVGDLSVQVLPYLALWEWLVGKISDMKYKSQLKTKAKAE